MMIADAWQILQGNDILKWLACLGILLWLWNEGKKALGNMGRDFVTKPEFDKFEKYIHDAHHTIRGDINAVSIRGQLRDEILAKLEERSISQGRQLDRIEQLIRNATPK